jgi:L-malate glycosyltransferase
MKILILTENYYAGGMDTFIVHLLNFWPAQDEFVLLCNYDHPGLEVLKNRIKIPCKIQTHNLFLRHRSFIRSTCRGTFAAFIRRAVLAMLKYATLTYHIFCINKLIGIEQPDRVIIVAGNYPGGETPRAAALRGLFHVRNSHKPLFIYHNDVDSLKKIDYIFEFIIDSLIERSVSHFITVSKFTQTSTCNRIPIYFSKKKKVIYNGTDLLCSRLLEGNSRPVIFNIPSGAQVIAMLGNYESRKGHELLLRAFAIVKKRKRIPNTHLIMAGFGYSNERMRVKSCVQELGLQSCVHLLEFQNDVGNILDLTDILVVPSLCKESFGYTIIEAFARQIPVIATCVGGMPEVLSDGGGVLVPLSETVLANRMEELLINESLRSTYGTQGRAVAEKRFDARKMSLEYYSLIQ